MVGKAVSERLHVGLGGAVKLGVTMRSISIWSRRGLSRGSEPLARE